MAATIKDIARRLNLSVSTVSYALNGGPKPVSQEVRDLVLEAARELNYRTNRQAKSLITGRNRTVGLVFPAISPNAMRSPFLQHALNGVVNAAEVLRQDVLLLTASDRNQEDWSEQMLDSRIDSLIFIAPPVESLAIERMTRNGVPYVVVGGDCVSPGIALNADNAGGVFAALRHLYDLGHRRIAHIAGLTHQTDGRNRLEAFRQFVLEYGLDVPEAYVQPGNFHPDGGVRGAQALLNLPEPPTAIFCANDGTAFGAIQAARQMGIDVPRELSVVGFDDHYLSESFNPPLTSVRQPIEEMGYAAIKAVVAMAEGDRSPIQTLYPTELVLRSTTAIPSA